MWEEEAMSRAHLSPEPKVSARNTAERAADRVYQFPQPNICPVRRRSRKLESGSPHQPAFVSEKNL